MKKRIFITACGFRAPGLKDFTDIIRALDNPDFKAPFEEIILSDRRTTRVARLHPDKTSPHYPTGSSLKVLRADVIAALICCGELMERAGLISEDMLDVPLYVSNGSSFDLNLDQVTEITTAYLKQSRDEDWSSRYQRVYRSLPPMYVLRTLANATQCFVSQKTGARGDNATFVGSSHSTHLALQEGMRKIDGHEAEMVLVGACNGIGIYSALGFGNSPESGFQWRESEGAGFFLLESEKSVSRSGRSPLAEIVFLRSSKNTPDVFSDQIEESPYRGFNHDLADFCIHSGGLSPGDYEREKEACESRWKGGFSWFDQLGTMGNNGIAMNMATSLAIFSQGEIEQIDCLNRDGYGRESFIKLKAVGH